MTFQVGFKLSFSTLVALRTKCCEPYPSTVVPSITPFEVLFSMIINTLMLDLLLLFILATVAKGIQLASLGLKTETAALKKTLKAVLLQSKM